MANLTIRNLDDKVVERLKKKAKDNGRSLEAELRVLLSEEAQRLSASTEGRRFWLYREGLYRPGVEPAWYLHGFFA